MTFWTAGAVLASSVIGSDAARSAGNKQADAAKAASDLQYRMFQEQQATQKPFLEAGGRALTKLEGQVDYKPFSYNAMTADPGYQFRLSEGMRALGRQAGARGGAVSGQSFKALQDYAQNAASGEYTNAFNRYQAERSARLNPLQSLAGVGQTATNTLSNEAGQYGQAMANNAAQMGNIRASGYMNQANALTGGLGQYLNYQQNRDFMKLYGPRRQPNYANSNQFQSDISDFEGIPGMGGN